MGQLRPLQLITTTAIFAALCGAGCTTARTSCPQSSANTTEPIITEPITPPPTPTAPIYYPSSSAPLQTVREDLVYAQLQTRETRVALERLVTAHRTEVEELFRSYSEGVARVTAVGERLVRHAEGIREQGSAYFVEEEKSGNECRYPRLSETAGTTSIELGDLLEPISRQSGLVKRSYLEFQSDLSLIRAAIGKNTDRKGVDAIEFFIRKAQVTGESLDQAIETALVVVQQAQQEQVEAEEQSEATPESEPPPAPVL